MGGSDAGQVARPGGFYAGQVVRQECGALGIEASAGWRGSDWLQVAFQARSSFAKGNPFSLFFGDPLFWDPLFSVFFLFFFLALQRLKCNLEPPRSVLDFESFAGRGRFLDGRVLGASQVE